MARPAPQPQPQAHRAVVRSAPSGPRERFDVRLQADPADVLTRVDHWSPRGTLLPQPGDLCLVIPDDEGHMWLAEWVPQAEEPAA